MVESDCPNSPDDNNIQVNLFGGISDNLVKNKYNLVNKNCDLLLEMKKLLQSLNSNVNMHKMNDKTATYYAHDIVSSGKKFIVSRMFENQHISQNDIFKSITMMEVNFQVTLSRFAYNMVIYYH